MSLLSFQVYQYDIWFDDPEGNYKTFARPHYGGLTLINPGGQGDIRFIAVAEEDAKIMKPYISKGLYIPIPRWQWEQMVNTVRHGKKMTVTANLNGTQWKFKTGPEAIG